MNSKNQFKGVFMLLITAIIWGSSFVSQKVGVDSVEPMTFIGIRTFLGGLVLIPFILLTNPQKEQNIKLLIIGGVVCGMFLLLGSLIQTYGIIYISAGKTGFLTSLYMIFVPLFGLFGGKKISLKVVLSVTLALVGMYLLCMTEGFTSVGKGDILVLICAIFFAFHILAIDYFSPKVDPVKLSCIQFLVCGGISILGMFIFETPTMNNIKICWFPIAYSGIMSCGIAYTLQVVGQKYTQPVAATLLMSLESVFSAVFGFLILNEAMSTREIVGCVITFLAVIYIQLPDLDVKKLFRQRN